MENNDWLMGCECGIEGCSLKFMVPQDVVEKIRSGRLVPVSNHHNGDLPDDLHPIEDHLDFLLCEQDIPELTTMTEKAT